MESAEESRETAGQQDDVEEEPPASKETVHIAGTDSYVVHQGAAYDWMGVDVMEYVVQVASYVGMAAVGGVIGNRSDAVSVAAGKRLFRSVISRWRKRRGFAGDETLSEDEARDIARGAALTMDWVDEESAVSVESAERDGDHWKVRLAHRPSGRVAEHLLVSVGPGDPADARILVIPD